MAISPYNPIAYKLNETVSHELVPLDTSPVGSSSSGTPASSNQPNTAMRNDSNKRSGPLFPNRRRLSDPTGADRIAMQAGLGKRVTQEKIAKSTLIINPDAIHYNLALAEKRLTESAAGGEIPKRAMVLKANGYGVGATALASIGMEAGVRDFFVALLSEGMDLREGLTNQGKDHSDVNVYVLHGVGAGEEELLLEAGCTPVLNTLEQIEAWGKLAKKSGEKLPAILQFDSGMRRAGVLRGDFELSGEEVSFLNSREVEHSLDSVKNLHEQLLGEVNDEDVRLMNDSENKSLPPKAEAVLMAAGIEEKFKNKALLENIDVKYVMSHLACAGDMNSGFNKEQLDEFKAIRAQFPDAGASLAASPGFYLGSDDHLGSDVYFDMVRFGSLTLGMESSESPSPLEPAIKLESKILQINPLKPGEGTGYGKVVASETKDSLVAMVSCGFGDGLPRGLSGNGNARINGQEVGILKVMMDSVMVDVTGISEAVLKDPKTRVEFLGPTHTIDDMAEQGGTIAADITTSLQGRVARKFVKAGTPVQTKLAAERASQAAV